MRNSTLSLWASVRVSFKNPPYLGRAHQYKALVVPIDCPMQSKSGVKTAPVWGQEKLAASIASEITNDVAFASPNQLIVRQRESAVGGPMLFALRTRRPHAPSPVV